MAQKAIAEREARIYRQIDTWDHKLSSFPIDRVMVAKIMCLSIEWYHAGIALGWEPALKKDTSLYLERRHTQGGQSHVKTTQKGGWSISMAPNG
jgi:hypothetical protein